MLESGTDLESFVTDYTLVYEENDPRGQCNILHVVHRVSTSLIDPIDP